MTVERTKILLVSNGFYPEISPRSYRATELAKEFCRQGHEVTVISKFRAHDYSNFLNEFPVTFKMWKGTRFPKIPEFNNNVLSFFGRAISRILQIMFEYPAIEDMFRVKSILKTESDYDMMISFAVPYPVHWGVAWARSREHLIAKIWVADCGDPYMGDVLDSFKKFFYFRFVEKWFCRKADFITIPVETAIQGYYPEFHNKIRVIPQGFDFKINNNSKEIQVNKVPFFAYSGSFITGVRDPKPLMNELIRINLPFRFYIFTNTPELLNQYKETLKEKLIVSDYVPRDELIEFLSDMDFLVNFDNNTRLNSPSKLIDYAIVNRPVLNIKKDFNSDQILAFIKRDYRLKMSLPDPKDYHINNITKLFLGLINK